MIVVLYFALTLFVSATLLFIVQPMVGKLILPMFGGTPAVWNACMVFFQAAVLGGYAYAHGTTAILGPRRQSVVHVLLLVPPLAVLPIGVATELSLPPDVQPVAWLFRWLIVALGAPVLMLASTAPLLQKWFAHTRHPGARDPYFLYAASNAGSLIALLGYPLIVEPNLTLDDQSRLWTAGYVALVLLALGGAVHLWRSKAVPGRPPTAHFGEKPAVLRRLRWVALSAVASSLLLGATSHITANVAAVPLLWVVPLALYLLTFVLAFSRRPRRSPGLVARLFPYVLLVLSPLVFFDTRDMTWLTLPLHLLLFFVIALTCHDELVRLRPHPEHLTGFYLWLSAGGVLGGLFNAVVAPMLFDTVVEYPLVVALSCFVAVRGGGAPGSRRERLLDAVIPAALAVLAAVVLLGFEPGPDDRRLFAAALIAVLAMSCVMLRERWLRFALGFAVYTATLAALAAPVGNVLLTERNFFGVKRVVLDDVAGLVTLVHGSTNHGMQWVDPGRRDEPTAYYDRRGPVGDVFADYDAGPQARPVAIVGLGAGGLAPYARPGRRFTFFEIDPAVERIARDSRYFSYLSSCGADCDVVIGDGRLSLARVPDGTYGMIFLDAFSSDAVPTHLLSREAVEVYLAKLVPGGILVFNITNAYLDLGPVMARLADDAGLACIERSDMAVPADERARGRMPTRYVAMSRRVEDLGSLPGRPGWRSLAAEPDAPLWTDRYCDIVSLFRTPRLPTLR